MISRFNTSVSNSAVQMSAYVSARAKLLIEVTMRRPGLLIVVGVLALSLLNHPVAANADSPIKIIDHSEMSSFGQFMDFHITVRSSMGRIVKARFVLRELPEASPITSCTFDTISSGYQANLGCKWDTSKRVL